jgi:hypothetical protein
MAENYGQYPGFVGRSGQMYQDEIQRCEAEVRRARGEQREPNFSNAWLDLNEGIITPAEYAELTGEAEPVTPEITLTEDSAKLRDEVAAEMEARDALVNPSVVGNPSPDEPVAEEYLSAETPMSDNETSIGDAGQEAKSESIFGGN